MSKNRQNGGVQAPAQRHAEGQHGQKTIDFLRKQAEKLSEKTRLARDKDRHGHQDETPAQRTERQASAKRKGS